MTMNVYAKNADITMIVKQSDVENSINKQVEHDVISDEQMMWG